MPVIKSAKKKLRKDKKRTALNANFRDSLSQAIKKAVKNPSETLLKKAVSLTDKAIKKNIIHKNKAARIKSKLSKLIPKKSATKATAKAASSKLTPKSTPKKK